MREIQTTKNSTIATIVLFKNTIVHTMVKETTEKTKTKNKPAAFFSRRNPCYFVQQILNEKTKLKKRFRGSTFHYRTIKCGINNHAHTNMKS